MYQIGQSRAWSTSASGNTEHQGTHSKVINHRLIRRNVALGYSRRTVHFVGPILIKPVEVNAGRLVSDLVPHIRNDTVILYEIEDW